MLQMLIEQREKNVTYNSNVNLLSEAVIEVSSATYKDGVMKY